MKLSYYQEKLKQQKETDLFRQLTPLETRSPRWVTIKGKKYLHFCSNDYLGLSQHPKLKQAAKDAIEKYGTGSGASRLISGNLPLYDELEDYLAEFKGTESALVFSTGYQANLGIISALVGRDDLIIIDRLCHASIVDAVKLSPARLLVYQHNNPEHLAKILQQYKKQQKCLVVTEGVFSMDGDLAPLPDLLAVTEKYGAMLMVDDAHSLGCLGESGKGTIAHYELNPERFIHIGTLSKAVGSLGGYFAGPKVIRDYLINFARSLIYSTALPPSVLAAALAGLKIINNEVSLREKLQTNINQLKEGIADSDLLSKRAGLSPIMPLMIGDCEKALQFAEKLKQKNIFAPAIRFPTVPRGEARIRLSLSAAHKPEDIQYLVATLKELS